jgi:predicted nucleotidyltransferase
MKKFPYVSKARKELQEENELTKFIKWLYEQDTKITDTFDLARVLERYMKGGKCQ